MEANELVEIFSGLGDNGMKAFYVYIAFKVAENAFFGGMLIISGRVLWKFFKKEMAS